MVKIEGMNGGYRFSSESGMCDSREFFDHIGRYRDLLDADLTLNVDRRGLEDATLVHGLVEWREDSRAVSVTLDGGKFHPSVSYGDGVRVSYTTTGRLGRAIDAGINADGTEMNLYLAEDLKSFELVSTLPQQDGGAEEDGPEGPFGD